MAKRHTFMNVVAWLTGVIVSLSVGFGMISGTLSMPTWIGGQMAMVAGWIVVLGTIVSVIMAIVNAYSK